MTAEEIFSQRLKNARIMKGFSMDDLCKKMDNCVSKMTISKYENNLLQPNSTIVISIAKALSLPFDYFFRPFTFKIESIKFSRDGNLSDKQLESVKENVSDLIERYMNIEEICNDSVDFVNPINEIIENETQLKEATQKIRKEWQLGTDGIVNVISLLEEHGIKIMEIDAPEGLSGLSSIVNEKYPVIIINKNFYSEKKRFIALHELAHIILKFSDSVSENQEEAYCDLFASEMLIPESVFKNLLGVSRHDISYQELKAIQMQYGISCESLMNKAYECGIISEQRLKYFKASKKNNPSFNEKIDKSYYAEENANRFNRLVYKALSNEFISISKAANLLNQSVEQVRGDLVLV